MLFILLFQYPILSHQPKQCRSPHCAKRELFMAPLKINQSNAKEAINLDYTTTYVEIEIA
jgi:hypothetical protein